MDSNLQSDRLLMALAEQLKTPLVQIAQLAELDSADPLAIQSLTTHALRSIDAFLQAEQQTVLDLEPVSIGAVLYDVANELTPLAQQWGVKLHIDERMRSMPVMAQQTALHTVITLLGGVLIQSQSQPNVVQQPELILGCHRTKGGVVVGAFANHAPVSAIGLANVRALYGRASQPLSDSGLQGAASIMLADKITAQLQSVLKAYRHTSLSGLGTLLVPSKQLRLLS